MGQMYRICQADQGCLKNLRINPSRPIGRLSRADLLLDCGGTLINCGSANLWICSG